jgi:glutamate formiminotransferase
MAGEAPVLECVPNVSEGRDPATIARLAASIRAVPGVRLMNVHADPDHHRSVFSFLGDPASVDRAALALAAAALEAIDMRAHRGSHPRLGALDVVPFVPLAGLTMAEAARAARAFGEAVAARHHVPAYFYGDAATTPDRRRLPDARRGGYEGLPARLRAPAGRPDAGPAVFDARAGAVLAGARGVLVAFNVWLDAADLPAARAIAAAVRESSGGLPALQALGIALPTRGAVLVSMNLTDYRRTSIPCAFDAVRREAARRGIGVARSELVGVAPRDAFAGRAPGTVGLPDFTDDLYLDTHLRRAAVPGTAITPGA